MAFRQASSVYLCKNETIENMLYGNKQKVRRCYRTREKESEKKKKMLSHKDRI